MEYIEAIENGFDLYDEIENEICVFAKSSDSYLDVKYEDGTLTVEADCRKKDFEANVKIDRKEILQNVLNGMSAKDAICQILKEKICMEAHEIKGD